MEKGKKAGLILFFAGVVLLLGFAIGLVITTELIIKPEKGEEYQVLSITASQQKETVDIGLVTRDIKNKVIIILKEQNGERIVCYFRDQNEIPVNLSRGDIIVLTKNDQLKII